MFVNYKGELRRIAMGVGGDEGVEVEGDWEALGLLEGEVGRRGSLKGSKEFCELDEDGVVLGDAGGEEKRVDLGERLGF